MQKTKYEELNSALNTFYKNLADYSDLSNTSVVRFSTINAVDKDKEETTNTNLQKLIMRDWTNWSDYYQKVKTEDSSATPNTDNYLHDLLIPETDEEKSTDTIVSTARGDEILEYPYVMTGGTYTWTGLKSFYDNMVDKDGLESGDKVYDIANDARDKYLIIFTDGRDNTVGTTDTKYNEKYSPEDHKADNDAGLAKAWADQLKDEGYTIYCVMLATGSISEDTNEDEFKSAKNFLLTLAGTYNAEELKADYQKQLAEEEAKKDGGGEKPDEKLMEYLTEQLEKLENDPEDHIIVVDPSKTKDGGVTVIDAFQQILDDIQQPRNDYNVQDYIDPRFNLVDKNGNLYQLGAGGKITIKNSAGGVSTTTVGDIIDNPSAYGYPYTPQDSYMVNRKTTSDPKSEDGYDWGDGYGTGYIYYDDEKDMYYLRWEDQVIPMEDETFDTTDGGKKLDVWSATIRLKAKDDFIGGNNILTNGNEAGENLVYSDATIENMDKNPDLYFADYKTGDTITYRKKLEVLSGTNRKINAVDANGVSQAVYGDGIDIPSSGFPRVTVNVRLKPLDAKNLNDVIYMGEVVSPTMMLADLENGYMEGSYYLEYLRRYAYRLYGYEAAQTPLLELLNQWLKINDKEVAKKTFTIPYIYLPEPIYKDDGTLETVNVAGKRKVSVTNSTGVSTEESEGFIITDFDDLNLCDITGFITYTWKREDKQEPQQAIEGQPGKYDITKEYVVKNTEQIKYNLQLKFTPLKEDDLPEGFKFDEIFIKSDSTGKGGDKFFNIADNEFAPADTWSIESNRTDYLQAMVKEEKTYTPHVEYNKDTEKWQLSTETTGTEKINEDTYDWDTSYKPVVGKVQIEGDKLDEYYTDTLNNVGFADKDGNTITDETGAFITGKSDTDVCSLVANTTYIKDVVNGALVLELVVDGKYLKDGSPIVTNGTYTFEATRYYDDPYDPLPYSADEKNMSADTTPDGKKYQLTFKVDSKTLPTSPENNTLYTVWATLTKVEVFDGTTYKSITSDGYAVENALPIGTYEISVNKTDMKASGSQYYLGKNDIGADVNFIYLKTDNAPASYTYDKFPDSVYNASKTAPESTGDGEYLIKNGENDNAPKNIADSNRTNVSETQTLTFYFGTVDNKEINGETLKNTKGYSRFDDKSKDYAKDRLGIILLSVDPNSLAISKMVTNTDKKENFEHSWEFTIIFKPDDGENKEEFDTQNKDGFTLTWYKLEDGNWTLDKSSGHESIIKFDPESGATEYKATIKLKHGEKVVISGLQEGKWQVTEKDERGTIFYSAHNNMDEFDDYVFSNETNEDIVLNPASHVDFVNEFPYELPSTGSIGINRYIFFGTMFAIASAIFVAMLWYDRRKRRTTNEQP